MLLVSTVSFCFILSGADFGEVASHRGLRQGDPLSPYLFLFCSEALSGLFREAENSNSVKGVKIARNVPCISHLLFADDTLVFCEVSLSAMQELSRLLSKYEAALGQKVNLEKSSMVLSRNVEQFARVLFAEALGIKVIEKHDKYLGLPAVGGRSKREMFDGLGGHPSVTWRSILGSRELTLAVSRWRLGNGKSINVWKDRWLPREPSFRCIQMLRAPIDLRVSELIDHNRKEWKIDLIVELFHPLDSSLMLATPIGQYDTEDRLIWHPDSKGKFTVKRAHHLALELSNIGTPSSSERLHSHWNFLWQHRIPNKVKIFGWKSCHNALPTFSNLAKRRIEVPDYCLLCSTEGESIF
ncbi:UNVERIFIED_CONTAM: putative mitochondrial protein [Sesamum angustifolium]|uniref:Mitochondrial protein n=1 Tax=Sesamum angustifolium TaxID=2727405 RepID=A0AAW2JCT2_9LAMI